MQLTVQCTIQKCDVHCTRVEAISPFSSGWWWWATWPFRRGSYIHTVQICVSYVHDKKCWQKLYKYLHVYGKSRQIIHVQSRLYTLGQGECPLQSIDTTLFHPILRHFPASCQLGQTRQIQTRISFLKSFLVIMCTLFSFYIRILFCWGWREWPLISHFDIFVFAVFLRVWAATDSPYKLSCISKLNTFVFFVFLNFYIFVFAVFLRVCRGWRGRPLIPHINFVVFLNWILLYFLYFLNF